MLYITLPALPGGAARVLRWLVAEGTAVKQGAPLAIVLTGRAELLLPAPAAGTLREPVAEGASVAPGEVLGRLVPTTDDRRPTTDDCDQVSDRVFVTPLARSIAKAHGIALTLVAGSGAGGRILAADIRAALSVDGRRWTVDGARPYRLPSIVYRPEDGAGPYRLLSTVYRPELALDVQRAVPAPLASATFELDASATLARAAALREGFALLRLPLSFGACVVEAVAALLPAHPLLNARWDEQALVLRRRVHLALGEGGEAGLCWSLVRDAGDLTLRGVARALATRGGEQTEAATFAVVSMATGTAWHSAHPPLPQTAAALSVGQPVQRAVAVGEHMAMRPMASLTLCYDARVVDHQGAARFLSALCGVLAGG